MTHSYLQSEQEIEEYCRLMRVIVSEWAREQQVLVTKVAVVAAVSGNSARLYINGDHENMTCLYPNRTGETLSVGQKVYLVHKYGNLSHGWILMK